MRSLELPTFAALQWLAHSCTTFAPIDPYTALSGCVVHPCISKPTPPPQAFEISHPFQSPLPRLGDRHFNVFLVNICQGGLCCPSVTHATCSPL